MFCMNEPAFVLSLIDTYKYSDFFTTKALRPEGTRRNSDPEKDMGSIFQNLKTIKILELITLAGTKKQLSILSCKGSENSLILRLAKRRSFRFLKRIF